MTVRQPGGSSAAGGSGADGTAADGTTPTVSLTFDNGPTAGVTGYVLDVLAERGVSATFFVIGTALRAPQGKTLIRRALAEGHRIGHHTMTHSILLGDAAEPTAAVQSEIAALAPDMEEFDAGAKLFRPYAAGGVLDHHVFSAAALEYLEAHGYTCVLWNSVPHDWDDPGGWVDRALADIMSQASTVVVLHDVDTGAMVQLPRFLDGLSARNVEIVPDFPSSCLPIRDGIAVQSLTHLTNFTNLTEETAS
jgi:peptidoglycan-N-acetylglucosamine deacetylase